MVSVSTKLRSFLSAVATLDSRKFLSLKCHEWSSSRSLLNSLIKLESNFNLQLIQTPPSSSEGVSKYQNLFIVFVNSSAVRKSQLRISLLTLGAEIEVGRGLGSKLLPKCQGLIPVFNVPKDDKDDAVFNSYIKVII